MGKGDKLLDKEEEIGNTENIKVEIVRNKIDKLENLNLISFDLL